MGIYDDLSKLDAESPTPKISNKTKERKKLAAKSNKTPVDQSIDQSTNRPVDQPTDRSTNRFTNVDALGAIVDRPRAFYITQKVDRWLDDAVRYLRDRGMHKMDRSVLVNALIHNPKIYKPGSLDKIRYKLLAHLTNKSLKKVQSTA